MLDGLTPAPSLLSVPLHGVSVGVLQDPDLKEASFEFKLDHRLFAARFQAGTTSVYQLPGSVVYAP